jgi:hypothetical protein
MSEFFQLMVHYLPIGLVSIIGGLFLEKQISAWAKSKVESFAKDPDTKDIFYKYLLLYGMRHIVLSCVFSTITTYQN